MYYSEVMKALNENWSLYLAVRTVLSEAWLTFCCGWHTLVWLVILTQPLRLKEDSLHGIATQARVRNEDNERDSPTLRSPSQLKTHTHTRAVTQLQFSCKCYGNFWTADPLLAQCSFFHTTRLDDKKKARGRIFNLVSTTSVIIRNDSWTWWNCIPNWKTKLLSDQHDFLVLAPR